MCSVQASAVSGGLSWLKSTRSGGSGSGACVEVARAGDGVAVRDSKDPGGTVLRFTSGCWASFLDEAKAGAHDVR
jgi:Domain of unknown function (DUF397)